MYLSCGTHTCVYVSINQSMKQSSIYCHPTLLFTMLMWSQLWNSHTLSFYFSFSPLHSFPLFSLQVLSSHSTYLLQCRPPPTVPLGSYMFLVQKDGSPVHQATTVYRQFWGNGPSVHLPEDEAKAHDCEDSCPPPFYKGIRGKTTNLRTSLSTCDIKTFLLNSL